MSGTGWHGYFFRIFLPLDRDRDPHDASVRRCADVAVHDRESNEAFVLGVACLVFFECRILDW